ncbi:hypothetical protein [Plantactinospora sp. KLBMP9567]|uniref:hypothetical protein n=1 Tax=Plantactinospora sp. KLBMP9567 TaxID=3085900 RepID=UPI0029814B63|nr:hypothetical protein [Plantactinospora sp. KLBMP9567]MDW5328020.1 hypothetical protein [Plantactinospora sp. KLBMP9567]
MGVSIIDRRVAELACLLPVSNVPDVLFQWWSGAARLVELLGLPGVRVEAAR